MGGRWPRFSSRVTWGSCSGAVLPGGGGSWAKIRGRERPATKRTAEAVRARAFDLIIPLESSDGLADDQVNAEVLVLVGPRQRRKRSSVLHGAEGCQVERIVPGRLLDLQLGHAAVAVDAEEDHRFDAAAHGRALPLVVDERQHPVQVVGVGEVRIVEAAHLGAEGGGAERIALRAAPPAELVARLPGSGAGFPFLGLARTRLPLVRGVTGGLR